MRQLTLAAALFAATPVHAQDPAANYPSRPIRIFGQGTGSTADYLSRYIAQKLTERWGQPVIVDRGGHPRDDRAAVVRPVHHRQDAQADRRETTTARSSTFSTTPTPARRS